MKEGLYKQYMVVRADQPDNVLESFSTLAHAETFLQRMKEKGEDVILKTNDEDIVEYEPFEIEEGVITDPGVEFGDEINEMFEDDDEWTLDDLPSPKEKDE